MDNSAYVSEVMGEPYVLSGSLFGYRSNHEIFVGNGGRVILKLFNDTEVFKNELMAQERFQKDGSLRIPRVYGFGDMLILCEYIEADEPFSLKDTCDDLAAMHGFYLSHPSLTREFPRHSFRNIPQYIESHQELFCGLGKELLDVTSRTIIKDVVTLTHGDLYARNVLRLAGKNYYTDFEFVKLAHPVRDLALLLLNHSQDTEEIVQRYMAGFQYAYLGLEKDAFLYAFIKGVQLIAGLKTSPFSQQEKTEIHRGLISSMARILRTGEF